MRTWQLSFGCTVFLCVASPKHRLQFPREGEGVWWCSVGRGLGYASCVPEFWVLENWGFDSMMFACLLAIRLGSNGEGGRVSAWVMDVVGPLNLGWAPFLSTRSFLFLYLSILCFRFGYL